MTVRFRKKSRKYRGSRSHGWGKTKKHKKSGIRGGVGKAAPKSHHWLQVITGKREPIGKRGFIRPPVTVEKVKAVNVSQLEAMIPTLLKKNKITKENNAYKIDLAQLSYNKLLGQGKVTLPLEITVESASERAVEKVEQAGGKVNTLY